MATFFSDSCDKHYLHSCRQYMHAMWINKKKKKRADDGGRWRLCWVSTFFSVMPCGKSVYFTGFASMCHWYRQRPLEQNNGTFWSVTHCYHTDLPHGPPWYATRAKLVRKHSDYSNNLRHFVLCKKWREMRRLRSCLPREWPQTMFIVLGGFQGERAGNDGSWSPGVVCGKQGGCRDVKREGLGWEKRRETHKIMTWHDTWGGRRADG